MKNLAFVAAGTQKQEQDNWADMNQSGFHSSIVARSAASVQIIFQAESADGAPNDAAFCLDSRCHLQ